MAAIELDHVLIAVTDLAEAERTFAERHGLVSIEGGRHPGWGTANRIVPLGDALSRAHRGRRRGRGRREHVGPVGCR